MINPYPPPPPGSMYVHFKLNSFRLNAKLAS